MKILIRMFFVATLCSLSGCVAPLPNEYANSPEKSLVIGNRAGSVNVLIRSVDDSEPLFRSGYNLGNKVWLNPGIHTVNVTCIENQSWGQVIAHKDIQIDVKKGYTYELAAYFDGKTPEVFLTALPSSGDFNPENEFPSVEFEKVMDSFIAAAKRNDIDEMIALTSDVTLHVHGKKTVQHLYANDISPFISKSNDSNEPVKREFVSSKVSQTGSGWIFYKKFDQPDGDSQMAKIIVVKENDKIRVTSVGSAD